MAADEQIKKDLPELHAQVLANIRVGKNNAITINYIIDRLALNRQQDRRKITLVLNDLIFLYGYPIGSSSDEETKGVFLIKDERDLTAACRTLDSRAIGLLERSRKVVENFNNMDQQTLGL